MEKLKNQQDFEELRWLNKAINPKIANKSLRVIHVEGGEAVATDGHRMHVAQTSLDDGNYIVELSNAKKIILQQVNLETPFPDYKMVLPKEKREVYAKHDVCANHTSLAIAAIIRELSKQWAVNIDYLIDALDNFKQYQWRIYIADSGATEKVYLENNKCKALIMPLKN